MKDLRISKNHIQPIIDWCYEKDNLRAYNYYKRNKFKFYAKNKNTIVVKKWIK